MTASMIACEVQKWYPTVQVQRVFVNAGENSLARITGSCQHYTQIRVYLDFDNDGVFDLPGELILSEDGGMVEDSHDSAVIWERICYSIESHSSGEWENPGFGRTTVFPAPFDVIRNHSCDTINVPVEIGQIECIEIKLKPGSIFNVNHEIRVIGVCNENAKHWL